MDRRGAVHRDIKADNVLIAADDTAKLGDFGLVKKVGGDPIGNGGAVPAADACFTAMRCNRLLFTALSYTTVSKLFSLLLCSLSPPFSMLPCGSLPPGGSRGWTRSHPSLRHSILRHFGEPSVGAEMHVCPRSHSKSLIKRRAMSCIIVYCSNVLFSMAVLSPSRCRCLFPTDTIHRWS